MHENADEPANDDARRASMNRRTFLERTGAIAGVGLGFGALQDDEEQQVKRKFALERVARFETDEPTDDYVGRGLLVTTKANVEGSPEGVGDCGFPDWSPERFVKYQVLLFDVNQGVITESRAFIAEGSDPIPTGTPFIINKQVPCSGRYVGVECEHVPSWLVE